MAHGNPPEYWERIINRFSKEAIESYEIHKCDSYLPCLPVDRNRIIFVTCKERYKNQLRYNHLPNCDMKFGDTYIGSNKILMRCPMDCAIVGSAYDEGKRYYEIKERTKGLKLCQPVIVLKEFITLKQRIWYWLKGLIS